MRPRSLRIAPKLALAAASLVACLALAEVAHRGWSWFRGRPYDAAATAAEIRSLVPSLGAPALPRSAPEETGSDAMVLHPFLGFDFLNNWGVIEDELAYFASGAAREGFDIVVLGGSVAQEFVRDGAEALVSALRADERLRSRPIRVMGHARAGFKQPQQVTTLAYLLLLGYEPDLVVNIDGFNEVAVGAENGGRGIHPLYPYGTLWQRLVAGNSSDVVALDHLQEFRASQRAAQRLGQRVLGLGLHRSSLLGRAAVWRLHRLRDASTRAQERYLEQLGRMDERVVRGPAFDPAPEAIVAAAAAGWLRGSRLLKRMCDDHAVPYVHVLQPTLLDPDSKPLTEKERGLTAGSGRWKRGILLGYPLLRQGAEELREQGVHFVDCTGLFGGVEAELYRDAVHFGPEGQALLAARLAAAIRAVAAH